MTNDCRIGVKVADSWNIHMIILIMYSKLQISVRIIYALQAFQKDLVSLCIVNLMKI